MARFALFLALAAAVASSEKVCTRTMRNREHLHPRQYKLPAPTEQQAAELADFPIHFDWCEQGMCTSSWNQHIPQYCGSCFAHGALSSAQDRIKIMNKKKGYNGPDVMLGRQTFLNCAPAHGLSNGCGGGEPADVYEFMHSYGLPDETCLPYNATDHTKFTHTNQTCPPEGYCMNCMHLPESPDVPVCFPVKKMIRYRAKEYGRISGEHAMMKELLNGPITCGIACSDGFTWEYSAGIFEDKTGFVEIDHDVEIVGWGEEDGVKYWHVRNSWGTYWGMNGFFKIVRGKNNLGIESDCHYVVPDVSEEELVFHEKPIYGGSHWGIKPFDKRADEFPLNTTDDVAYKKNKIETNELPDRVSTSAAPFVAQQATNNAATLRKEAAPAPILSTPVLLVAFTTIGAAVGFAAARLASPKRSYATIN